MKRLLTLALILALALPMLAPAASAGEYKIYGDGSYKLVYLPDSEGTYFEFYDIYQGQTRRTDLSSPNAFIERLLTAEHSSFGYFKNPAKAWDGLLLYKLANALSRTGDGQTLGQLYHELDQMGNAYKDMNSTLVTSGNPRQANEAIRETFAGIIRRHVDGGMATSRIKNIEGLDGIKTNGPIYATVNAIGRKGRKVLGYGSIFYDFSTHFLCDGTTLDSAAGNAKTPEEAKDRSGFSYEKTSANTGLATELVNKTSQKVSVSQSIGVTNETSAQNSHSYSSQIHTSGTISSSVTTKVQVPLVTEVGVTAGLSFTAGWAGTTTNGYSKTETKSSASSLTVKAKLPPNTRIRAKHIENITTITNRYDYPIGITYKVAHYVIWNDERSSIVAKWGVDGDPAHESAAQNLRKRTANSDKPGYEIRYGSEFLIDWSQAKLTSADTYTIGLRNFMPMSLTGGALSTTQKSISIELEEPTPLNPVAKLQLAPGPRQFQMGEGGVFDLTANLPVRAVDKEGVPVYGFDELQHGDWVFCDANGHPVDAFGKAEVFEQPDGREELRAAKAKSDLYLKFVPEDFPYIDPELYDDSGTIVSVKISGAEPAFAGTVQVSGEVHAELHEPFDLRQDGPTVSVFMPDGTPVLDAPYGLNWSMAPGESQYASIRSGILTGKVPGEYSLIASYGGVKSKPVKLTVSGGAPVSGIELEDDELTVNKFETVQVRPTVLPANSQNKGVTFKSLNPEVATVNDAGLVTGVSTGTAVIVVTTDEGGFEARCVVRCEVPKAGEGLNRYKIAMQRGAILKLSNPGGTAGSWSVADKSIASLKNGRLTAEKLGETTLTFQCSQAVKGTTYRGKALQPGDLITVPLVVRRRAELATGIALGQSKAYLAPGEMLQLTPTVTPAKARDREVFYQSSDKTVALVEDQGLVRGVRSGTAIITATTATGQSKKLSVRVTADLLGIRLNHKSAVLTPGEALLLEATPVPAGVDFTPHFESSNPKVATVDEAGLVQALSKGRCTITVHPAPASQMKATLTIEVR